MAATDQDPAVASRAVANLYGAAVTLLARLAAMEASGVLGPEASDACRGWRERLGSAAESVRQSGAIPANGDVIS